MNLSVFVGTMQDFGDVFAQYSWTRLFRGDVQTVYPDIEEYITMIAVGDLAPDFTLSDQSGEKITLSGLRDKTVVLFFYPKADTPGCTVEACGFRDQAAHFATADAVLLGISPDPVEAQQQFAAKYGLPMRLLADVEHAVAEAYGVWVQKSMYGRTCMGVSRETFVIAPEGSIRQIFRKVKVDAHSEEVLKAIRDTAKTTEAPSEEVAGGE